DIPSHSTMNAYHDQNSELYQVSAQRLSHRFGEYFLFKIRPFPISLRSKKTGLRTYGKAECQHLFSNSFFGISGAMGELGPKLEMIASTKQPVMILGEPGTGKEQIAKALYLQSPLKENPFIVADCTSMIDKSWNFLFEHNASPLYMIGCTLYFQHLESLSPSHIDKLISVITETNLAQRIRILFSCDHTDTRALTKSVCKINKKLGCFTLKLPTLRSRTDEISSLASLYLANLNNEMGKQIIGFEPHAINLLQDYTWPNNYTQFKQVLSELATLTDSSYIRESVVAEILSTNRSMYENAHTHTTFTEETGTLEQRILHIVQDTINDCGGNQSAAARSLGISRTTLWRYLNRLKER
ncbi:MAG: sigma 54-interacting transcriptional regulator, partial [Clostridiales bacterium]|nr:sigma 54-interacting transcriptional regulator [Clostridiales bacterium]